MPITDELTIPTASRVVRQWLEQRVGSEWPAGHRLPTIAQLSRDLGVGYVTVQRAVREMAESGMLVSRRGAGITVAHAPQSWVQSARGRGESSQVRQQTVCVISAQHPERFVQRGIDAFLHHLHAQGDFAIMRIPLDHKNTDFRGRIDADAVMLINPDSYYDMLFDDDKRIVVISTAVDLPIKKPLVFDVVTVEHEQGGMLAGQFLRDAGAQTACFLGTLNDHFATTGDRAYDPTSQARLRGFERAWGASIPAENQLRGGGYSIESGARLAKRFLSIQPRPEGVFAASDELAVGFILGAVARGLEAGRDFKIVGFDGQQIGRGLQKGALSTVEVPMDEMGKLAADLLASRLADPEQPMRRVALGCKLFAGATVSS